MYDIRDVINKYKSITQQRIVIYEKSSDDEGDIRNRMVLNIFVKSAEKELEHCDEILSSISDQMAGGIDFDVYDKISFLVNQFSRTLTKPLTHERRQLVVFGLNQEKSVLALLLDIQGRMMMQTGMAESIAYYVLWELIEIKKAFIDKMERI